MRRRKRAAKRVRADPSRVAEPKAPSPLRMEPFGEPKVAPPIQEATGVPYADTAYTRAVPSGSGSQDGVGSVLTPSYALRKSKNATCPEVVAAWADLPPNHIGAHAATHAMVVNSSIHTNTPGGEGIEASASCRRGFPRCANRANEVSEGQRGLGIGGETHGGPKAGPGVSGRVPSG
ncbi:PREDICTED: uncharacterized protein LOC109114127 [Nelumbo nucifera]|uniref:Uncharacterized protein LOC109114127 n=1 Tax=Nelumbo nucifera TaxID=4432 RepID=A0A1U8PZ89_NELNU|nr:PREDICTED: uncharacterized protein LOC109114127 [Nelumbo nucifera]